MISEINSIQIAALIGSFAGGWVLRSYGPRVVTLLRHLSSPKETKLVFVVRTDLRMSPGKVASQCSHAAVSCYRTALQNNPKLVNSWINEGQPKIVLRANEPGDYALTSLASMASHKGITSIIIRDAGRTEVAQGSATVLGLGPADAQSINDLTRTYRLY